LDSVVKNTIYFGFLALKIFENTVDIACYFEL